MKAAGGPGNLVGMAGDGTALGTVVRWDDARGGGVIEALEVPGGCWADGSVAVHGSAVGGGLRAGQNVEFDRAEPGEAGFLFRALRVVPREDLHATVRG